MQIITILSFLFFSAPVAMHANSSQEAPRYTPQLTPVLQGATSSHSAEFSILSRRGERREYSVKDQITGTTYFPFSISTFNYKDDDVQVDKFSIESLNFNGAHVLEIIHPDGGVERRPFKLLDPNKKRFRLAVATCSNYMLFYRLHTWQLLIDQNPDLVILGGDNVYAGFFRDADADLIWKRYVKTRERIPYFRNLELFPTVAIWDDHDYGKDGAGADFQYKKESTEIFNAFYAQRRNVGTNFESGPGISSFLQAYGVNFLLLDNRSFYNKEGEPFWGTEQREWIANKLNEYENPFFIFNGTQFYGGYRGGESVEATHKHALKWLNSEIDKSGRLAAFGSGDRHFSEVMKIEGEGLSYKTYEFTSSSMHSIPRRPKLFNPRRVASNPTDNFLMFDIEVVSNDEMLIDVTSITYNGSIAFQGAFDVKK